MAIYPTGTCTVPVLSTVLSTRTVTSYRYHTVTDMHCTLARTQYLRVLYLQHTYTVPVPVYVWLYLYTDIRDETTYSH